MNRDYGLTGYGVRDAETVLAVRAASELVVQPVLVRLSA
jgi:hypothetical protein